ncbi:MAG: hypothetical protein WBL23_02660 [Salinisphaera sp.]|uniref:hypothetical protein n=1 Tax=Salinisphaera sp. TaxID=1914330 RepID=UPI003C7A8A6B
MLHAVNAAQRWLSGHRLEFGAMAYIGVFVALTFIGIFNGAARQDHRDLFTVAWALLFV